MHEQVRSELGRGAVRNFRTAHTARVDALQRMALYLSAILDSELNNGSKVHYLELFSHLVSTLSHKEAENLRNRIKTLLNSGKTKNEGLSVLNWYLDECPDDVLAANGGVWLQTSFDGLAHLDERGTLRALVVMEKIIRRAGGLPEFTKSLSTSFFNKVIDYICSEKHAHLASLRVLDVCLSSFPGFCSARRSQIKSFVVNRVVKCTHLEEKVLQSCFAKLVYVGSQGGSKLKNQQLWGEQVMTVLANMNHLLSLNWTNDVTKANGHLSMDRERYFTLKSDNLMSTCLLIKKQFEFLAGVVVAMLTIEYPFVIEVPVSSILETVSEVLSMKINHLTDNLSIDNALFFSILPSLKCSGLRVLEALIATCKTNIVTSATTVNQLLMRILKSTNVDSGNFTKPLLELRTTCYEVLYKWFSSLGAYSALLTNQIDWFIEQVCVDVSKVCSLKFQNKSFKSDLKSPLLGSKTVVCQEACLKAVSAAVVALASLMTKEQYLHLSSVIANEILGVYRLQKTHSFGVRSNTRFNLLQVLRNLLLNVPASAVAPIGLSVVIFNEILRLDQDEMLQSYARESLSLLNNLTNPKVAVFHKQFSDISMFDDILMQVEEEEQVEMPCVKKIVEMNGIGDAELKQSEPKAPSEKGPLSNGSSPRSVASPYKESISEVSHSATDQYIYTDEHVDEYVEDTAQEETSNTEEHLNEERAQEIEVLEISDSEEKNLNDDDDSRSTIGGECQPEKRQLEDTAEENQSKKYKTVAENVSNSVEELLQDFVDAPPDS